MAHGPRDANAPPRRATRNTQERTAACLGTVAGLARGALPEVRRAGPAAARGAAKGEAKGEAAKAADLAGAAGRRRAGRGGRGAAADPASFPTSTS